MDTKLLLQILTEQKNLSQKEAAVIASRMMQGSLSPASMAAFLTAFRIKGETVEEIVAFVNGMKQNMTTLPYHKDAIDTCGTGGDNSGTFNISTASAFVVASCGVPVAKHGNRSASSRCGSADVLEALGIPLQMTPQQASSLLKKTGFTFLFAPLYLPSMKHVAPIRKELGIPTVFNVLGPFLNPMRTKKQIIGVPNLPLAKKLAQVAASLGYEHIMIVTSQDGLDEISLFAKTIAFSIKKNTVRRFVIDPQHYGFAKRAKVDIRGGNAKTNATIIEEIFSGKKGAKRDIVILNSAYALLVSGRVQRIGEGIKLATEAIDGGDAATKLEEIRKEAKQYERHA